MDKTFLMLDYFLKILRVYSQLQTQFLKNYKIILKEK
jgi:hypothetical protein